MSSVADLHDLGVVLLRSAVSHVRALRSKIALTQSAAALLVACGAEQTVQPRPDGPTETPDTGVSSTDAAIPPVCETPHYTTNGPEIDFQSLAARVVDLDGNPVVQTLAQACGSNVCLPGQTDNSGKIRIDNPQPLSDGAFKYGDGLHHAQFALALEESPAHDLGDQVTVAFPDLALASALEAGTTLESAGARITLTDDADVHFDLLAFPDVEQHVFVAASIATEQLPEAAVVAPELAGVWALGPLKTRICPPAALKLPNTTQLNAGSAVEFVLHGTDVSGAWAKYTAWGRIATGHISDDGKFILTDPESGISQLGVLGIRALP